VRHEEIDWAGLRAAAIAVGIRQAARQAARDLPSDEQERFVQRAMKRCSREKWLIKCQQDKADAVVTSPTALSANVRKGSEVLPPVNAINYPRFFSRSPNVVIRVYDNAGNVIETHEHAARFSRVLTADCGGQELRGLSRPGVYELARLPVAQLPPLRTVEPFLT
jgi:hypothetical protein